MASLDTLTSKLESINNEIAQEQDKVLESLRSFYSTSSSISADEAVKMATKWSKILNTTPKLETSDHVPQSEEEETIKRLNQVLLDAVDRLQLGQRGDKAPEAHVLLSIIQRQRLQAQVDESTNLLTIIDQVSQVDQLVHEVEEASNHQQFLVATKRIETMENVVLQLSQLTNEEEEGEKLVRVLQCQLQHLKKRLINQLKDFFTDLAAWNDNGMEITTGFPANETESTILDEFWTACERMELLLPLLNEMAQAVSKHLIRPMVDLPGGRLEKGGNEAAEVEQKCTHVVTILAFLHAELFARNDERMKQFGDVVWKVPGNLEAQLIKLVQENIPHDATALDTYKTVLTSTVMSLENSLSAIGLTACRNSQLRSLVEQLEQLYSTKRRRAILSIGRDFMRQGYRESMKICQKSSLNVSRQKVGSDEDEEPASSAASDELESTCFQAPNYRVTVCAHHVVELAHQTLIEACTSDQTSAALLFQTVRDLFLLFRTIIPTLYKEAIANDATTCMLYHNDCLYLVYHVLVIGNVYNHRLPAPLNRTATMVDMVSIFREAGEQALSRYLAAHMDEIFCGLENLPSLGAMDIESNFKHVELFIEQALSKLQCLHSAWHDEIPLTTYHQLIARTLDRFVQHFVDQIFVQSKISDKAKSRLFSLLLKCETLFRSSAQAAALVPSLARCSKLRALLTTDTPAC